MDPWEEPVWQDSLDCTQLGAETCDDNEILLLYELITCITSGWFVKKECSAITCELQFIHIFHDIQQLIIYHTSWTLSVSRVMPGEGYKMARLERRVLATVRQWMILLIGWWWHKCDQSQVLLLCSSLSIIISVISNVYSGLRHTFNIV